MVVVASPLQHLSDAPLSLHFSLLQGGLSMAAVPSGNMYLVRGLQCRCLLWRGLSMGCRMIFAAPALSHRGPCSSTTTSTLAVTRCLNIVMAFSLRPLQLKNLSHFVCRSGITSLNFGQPLRLSKIRQFFQVPWLVSFTCCSLLLFLIFQQRFSLLW